MSSATTISRHRHPLASLAPSLVGERAAIALTVAVVTTSLVILSALAVLASLVVGRAVVLQAPAPTWIWWLLGALVAARALLTWWEMDLSHSLAYRVLDRLRMALFDRYAVALPSRRRENVGHAAATAMSDTERLEFFYAHTVAQLVGAGVTAAAGGVVLAWVSVPLAGVVALAVLALVATIPLAGRRTEELGRQLTDHTSQLSARSVDVLGGLREILGYGMQQQVRTEMARASESAAHVAGRIELLTRLVTGAREGIVTLASAGVVAAAVVSDLPAQHLAPAVLLALVVVSPVADAAATLAQLQPLRASAGRVREELDRPRVLRRAPSVQPVPEGPLGLAFTAVDFGYDDRPVLSGFDLEVAAGEHLGIRGPSGVGKSTVVALAGRLWDPDAGQVELVGVDRRVSLPDLDDPSLRSAVAVVEQDGRLFHGTVLDNLGLGLASVSRQEAWQALEQVGLDDIVGLDDVLGESGLRLSGGQQARLRLAQALVRRPRVLVVDEPTADLDPDSAARIVALLRDLPATVIVVSHRADSLRECDRVFSLHPPTDLTDRAGGL